MARNYVSIEDHCKYATLLQPEGESYSGRLKYLQNCRSLIFIHGPQWIQHFEYLLSEEGEKQNYVEVERDFSDLDEKVNYYLEHPDEADRIIENSVRTFRDRYTIPAATSCYWRRSIKGYAEVSEPPVFYTPNGK